ncbi:MAG: hypothetical protein ABSF77_07025 [Spirochaetia bacterium]|jgi:xanthosine utilization system XapX-like protein
MFRAIIAGVLGLLIGVVFTAVLNLVSPAENVVRLVIVVCLAALVSAFSGYLLGARQKK